MTNKHPITPPPELLDQWCMENNWRDIAIQAAQWGADRELEACVKWIEDCGIDGVFTYDEDAGNYILSEDFRAARRPKPLSLKEQALTALRQVGNCEEIDNVTFDTIRRALEALDD
jgi:hypothetical protein